MKAERVTAADVARLAGVSQSAVSRVFTPGRSASPATAEKVRRAAEKLGYRPNVLARSLITGRSRIIGLVVAYLDNYFYPDAVERLSRALQARGYHVLIFLAPQTAGPVDEVLEEILDYQVDGIVMASAAMSTDLAGRCQAAGIPVVLFNRGLDDPRFSSVTSDNRAGGAAIGDFLARAGHRRPAHIAGWEGAQTQRDREAGFVEGLARHGLSLHARAVGNFRMEQARDAARTLLGRPDRPDALFVANDHMAFAAMDVARFELGLAVPGDLSVVGFDDVPIAAWPAYDLTTWRQRAAAMVAETVEILIGAVGGALPEPRRTVIPGHLVVRGSARRPEAT